MHRQAAVVNGRCDEDAIWYVYITRANVQPPNNPWHMATSALTVCTRSNPLEEVCLDADQQVFADVMYLMGCTKREVSLSIQDEEFHENSLRGDFGNNC